jgi:aspartate ammonia-lyase
MPGKVNPVIPEAVCQAAIAAMGHDQIVVQAASAGNFELSQFLPLVADSLLTMLDLLTAACDIFARLCVAGIEAREDQCRRHVEGATAAATALVDELGYTRASKLSNDALAQGRTLREVAIEQGLLSPERFDALVAPEKVTRLGSDGG